MRIVCNNKTSKGARPQERTARAMKKFEEGKSYEMRSVCDHECKWSYTVKARTASTITLIDEKGKEIKCRIIKAISEMDNREAVKPLGNYSMCPILRA